MESAKAIQIITLENHNFGIQTEALRSIIEQDYLVDRKLVVVTIAGAFRKGKSFLLNFFLKFLYAQYIFKDATNWISRNDTAIQGFKARGGPERETTGIWMWSDIFTHDFENGEKVAIVLLDTQGIFDDESTTKDCTAIFAISMMLSSVQCYNVMQNIQEDDLNNLQMFTEYARLAKEQSTEKPFQNLLFLIRDWFYPTTHAFGNGQRFIEQKLTGNDRQTLAMRQLRQRIQESFEKIGAFMLPFPGKCVAEAENASSVTLDDIDELFIKHVQELVPSIFAPEKLVVKKINGQKLRIGDLMTYLQTYLNIFNSDILPEPRTVLMATAEASNQILHGECMNNYMNSMEESFDRVPYFEDFDLLETHKKEKESSLSMFQRQRKLGDDMLIGSFQDKLLNEIEEKLKTFASTNAKQRTAHIEKEKAKEDARIAAEQKAEAERIAEQERIRRIQEKADADERDRIRQEEIDRLAREKAIAEERARHAEWVAQQEKLKSKKEKNRGISKVLRVGAAVIIGAVVSGPIGAAIALKEAGEIIDS